ncbi:MAG: anti-sigma factor [Sphingomicrobium sp.]
MDDDLFFAWLDGELDAETAARVAAQVAADPGLHQKAGAHRSMQTRLRGAFEPLLAAPPVSDNVIDMKAARSRKVERQRLPAMTQWAAIAATLVVGLVTGTMISGGTDSPVRSQAGQLVASGPLDRALDTRLAGAPAASGPRIGLTFRNEAGSICRSFSDGATQGLACREGDDWALRGLVQGASSGRGDYRMAAGSDPALSALVDSRMKGEPFDAASERKALNDGWR